MKIISGTFRSLKIKTNQKLSYRPTKSRVRQSIFDTLRPYEFDNVLDLFSGSGIMGFEAASRGSQHITFVEDDYKAMALIKKNSKIFTGPSFNFFKEDVFSFLDTSKKYDLIFADPPYDKYELEPMIEKIINLLNENGVFILECSKKQKAILGSKVSNYGKSRLLLWKN